MGFFSVNTELVTAADEQTVGFKPLASAIYKVAIQAAYIVESSKSDAKALTIQYKTSDSDRVMYESLWYQEGRGLNTYNKAGKEILLPSFTSMLDLFAAAGLDIETIAPTELKVTHYGTEGMYPVFKELSGAVLDFGVRQTLVDDYKETSESVDDNEVQLYVNAEGKSGGEIRGAKNAYTVASWTKMIGKKPVKDGRKHSKGGATPASSATPEAAAKVSSW